MEKTCKKCGKGDLISVEYEHSDPYRYDGTSELYCFGCQTREGRWTGKILGEGEKEPPYGSMDMVTTENRHYNQ